MDWKQIKILDIVHFRNDDMKSAAIFVNDDWIGNLVKVDNHPKNSYYGDERLNEYLDATFVSKHYNFVWACDEVRNVILRKNIRRFTPNRTKLVNWEEIKIMGAFDGSDPDTQIAIVKINGNPIGSLISTKTEKSPWCSDNVLEEYLGEKFISKNTSFDLACFELKEVITDESTI